MRISTILDHIDNGHMALPEFQRGYVWNREQVRGLFESLYRRHPVGGLLVWATEAHTAAHRGGGTLAAGIVKLLLDGQQRMTSLYGVVRGKAPQFFDGNAQAFTGLWFHLGDETFQFHQPNIMAGNPLWIDVTALLKGGMAQMGTFAQPLSANPEHSARIGDYYGRLARIVSILEIELHIEEVSGPDKTLDVVVDIFNRVNSGGTKLSKGDLALAKICAEWPEARDTMKTALRGWAAHGYHFNLDWLLRSVNTVLTGEAKFSYLHDQGRLDIENGLQRAKKHIDTSLNLIASRLGLDHDRVFFGRFGVPVMVRYLDQMEQRKILPTAADRDKLVFWFAQAGMWGRFSGSTESFIDQDLAALENSEDLDVLLEQLRLWHGGLRVEAGHFAGSSLGARFYPVLYMLTRMGGARDWGTNIELRANLLGYMSRLEVHHIFPKSQLYERQHSRNSVNALANFCFLTKDTNLSISNRLPEVYFEEIEARNPGALASQWIPMDRNLWKMENYEDFLRERRTLLADEANTRFAGLLHGDTWWLDGAAVVPAPPIVVAATYAGTLDESEEAQLDALNDWIEQKGLPRGVPGYDHADRQTGEQIAIIDLAWPNGLQEGLTSPVAVLLNEDAETLSAISAAGYRCFTSASDFQGYVTSEIVVN